MFLKIFLFLITIVIIVALFPKEYRFRYDFSLSKPWLYEDLIAPFDFAVKKPADELKKEKEEVVSNIRPYYKEDSSLAAQRIRQIESEVLTRWREKYGETDQRHEVLKNTQKVSLKLIDSIYRRGIIEITDSLESGNGEGELMLVRGNVAEERLLADFYTIRTADLFIREALHDIAGIDRDIAIRSLEDALVQNVVYDEERTQRETLARMDEISLTRGIVQKGERIISRGEIVGAEKYQLLLSLKDEYEGQLGGGSSFWMIVLGQAMLITIAIIVLVLFLAMFRADLLADNRKLILILSMIILMVVATSILIRRFDTDLVCLVPLCLVPFIIRAFYDTRLGLFVHIITIVIIGFLVPNGFEFVFLQLIAGIVTIISVVNLEKRSQFFLTSIYVFIAYSATYTGMKLAQDGSFEGLQANNYLLFAGSSALTLLSFPLIYLYEKIFGYVTSLSLLELSSINNKLLRELSIRAPGTFQHSLQVANLAEEAVYRIKGNSILARTGALYHDIGKLDDAMYFIENQVGVMNPHDQLQYTESAKIIMGHVAKGVELAHRHKLPEPIIDFIRTHHGTGKTGYFFKLFKKEHTELSPEEVAIFTYPGPQPFSKETAVVMMADAVEASSKSLKHHDKQSISELVENIIDGQIEARQFKNCNITLKDITRVKHVFKHRLMNIYHVRVEYPQGTY